MSYILDAIKKADQKRKLGTVPDVHTVHELPIAESRRPGWLYGLAIVLLLNAVGIGWWLWPAGSSKQPVTPAEKVATVPGAAATKPPLTPPAAKTAAVPGGAVTKPPVTPSPTRTAVAPEKGASEPEMPPMPGQAVPQPTPVASVPPPPPPAPPAAGEPPPSPPAPAALTATPTVPPAASQPKATELTKVGKKVAPATPPQPGQARVGVPVAEVVTPPAPGVAPAQAVASEPVVPVLAPVTPETAPDEAIDSDGTEVAPGTETVGKDSNAVAQGGKEFMVPIASSPPAKAKGKRRGAREEEDPELAKIPFLKQLSAEVQQGLPELRISFHAYSIKPKSRLVSIGGKVLREGDTIDEGIKLDTITAQGVVISANGQRFRMDVQ